MRKFIALLFAVAISASLSTSADAAKKRKAAKPDPVAASHQATAAFLRDAWHPLGFKSAAPAKAKRG
jgi:hypothetical protein